jgi:hypothetical protein
MADHPDVPDKHPVPAEPAEPVDPASDIGGLPDLGGLLDGFQKMQEAQSATYEGSAGGGAVKVVANGSFEFESVTIEPSVLEGADVEMIQDLVLAALHDLMDRIAEAQQDVMGGMDLGGLGGIGGIGDLLGGLGGLGGPEVPGH